MPRLPISRETGKPLNRIEFDTAVHTSAESFELITTVQTATSLRERFLAQLAALKAQKEAADKAEERKFDPNKPKSEAAINEGHDYPPSPPAKPLKPRRIRPFTSGPIPGDSLGDAIGSFEAVAGSDEASDVHSRIAPDVQEAAFSEIASLRQVLENHDPLTPGPVEKIPDQSKQLAEKALPFVREVLDQAVAEPTKKAS